MKNKLLLVLSWLLRRLTPVNCASKRFLIVSTTALGDSIWATPAIESLRRSFPDSRITVLTSAVGEQIFQNNPWITEILRFDLPLISLWKRLKREKIDTVLFFHASQRFILPLCSTIGASKIIGTAGINKGLDRLLTIPLENRSRHEIARRLEIAERAGAKTTSERVSIFLTPEEFSKGPQLEKGPWIALHPGSKDGFKRWPAEHFGAVGRRMQQMGYRILITGQEGERQLMEHIAAHIPGAELSDPKLTLRSFAALLSQVDLLISNDTGPVHLACALKRPVIALYAATNPDLCGPYAATAAFSIARSPTCDPCLKKKCSFPFCLMQIGPDEVVNKARDMLKKIVYE